MKKVLRIEIAKQPFNMEEDAFVVLDGYLKSIQQYFNVSTEGSEVIEDIEERISEHLFKRITKENDILILSDIKNVIEIIGSPEEFSEDGNTNVSKAIVKSQIYKRFYRDPDNRILGGVCSGLASYLDIKHIVIRLIFVFCTLFFATGPVIYLVLWIVIPPARTPIQKMEMKGEQINIATIRNSIKREYENISKSWIKA
jgi:phage shock protein PspC (stress-responsive transcriptional regulator)